MSPNSIKFIPVLTDFASFSSFRREILDLINELIKNKTKQKKSKSKSKSKAKGGKNKFN